MFNRFDSVVYFVKDVHFAAKWYAEILNADVKYENEMYAYIDLDFGKIGFHPEDEKSKSNTSGQTIYWRVESVSAAIEELIIKGAKLYRSPFKTDLDEFVCMIIDPFGNSFGLISDAN
jgi:predicted enzyme related to lactoylglutathione lyase